MADVFISYSKSDRSRVEALAHRLEESGHSVWWDSSLLAGQNFRDAIKRELEAARAVVVLWTTSSVKSEWVISEAQRALVMAKLVPVRDSTLSVDHIPQPFDIRHTITDDKFVDLRAAITALPSVGNAPTSEAVAGPSGTAAQRHPISLAPKLIVAVIFLAFGISFVAFPALLIYEFRPLLAFDLIAIDARHMLFFPIVGMLVLASYFIPFSALIDMYWNYTPYGRMRLLMGAAIVVMFAVFISETLSGSRVRSLWGLSPMVLEQPIQCIPPTCNGPATTIAQTLRRLREVAISRANLSAFAVRCTADPLQDVSPDNTRKYCFAAGRVVSGPECCAAQLRFSQTVYNHWESPSRRSVIGTVYESSIRLMMIMFVMIVTMVGLFLVSWRKKLEFIFPTYSRIIRRHAVVGSGAMMLFVLMDFGSDRSYSLLFGEFEGGSFRLSLVLVPWFALVVIYLLGTFSLMLRLQFLTLAIILADIAIANWSALIGVTEKLFGAGMSGATTIGALVIFVMLSVASIVRAESEQKQI